MPRPLAAVFALVAVLLGLTVAAQPATAATVSAPLNTLISDLTVSNTAHSGLQP